MGFSAGPALRVREASSLLSATVKLRSTFAIFPNVNSDRFLKDTLLSTDPRFILLFIRQAPYSLKQSSLLYSERCKR